MPLSGAACDAPLSGAAVIDSALSQTLAQFQGAFLALPSARHPRWLLPMDAAGGRVPGGLEIYTPYTPMARLGKLATQTLLRAGWRGRRRDRVLLTARQPLALEKLVAEITGEPRPMFALALGTAGRYRKLTAQAMRPDGEILGYLKFPLTAAAGARIRHEAAMLEGLWQYTELRPHLPRVLHAGLWEDGYLLFQSSGPAEAAGVEFGPAHEAFLRRLAAARRTGQAGERIVERTAERWRAVAPRLSAGWRELGSETLRRAAAGLRGAPVDCGIGHGDFAPWNTRAAGGRLFVYDWEAADWDAPLGWDGFHFDVQVASLLGRRGHRLPPPQRAPLPRARASFWLYLLHSACLGMEEQSPACPGVDFRRQLLMTELRCS